ncbi:hypothetical protein MJT46_000012 [Ovis ammon polii x Ovis aries]|nr:hypothetical protein MJT46_000012 [Ovis ammon polii x Ovis aries]
MATKDEVCDQEIYEGSEPESPALPGKFLISGPPVKSQGWKMGPLKKAVAKGKSKRCQTRSLSCSGGNRPRLSPWPPPPAGAIHGEAAPCSQTLINYIPFSPWLDKLILSLSWVFSRCGPLAENAFSKSLCGLVPSFYSDFNRNGILSEKTSLIIPFKDASP